MAFTLAELDAAADLVHRHVPATPQLAWPLLGSAMGAQVWVKHENQTPTGAFKVRGGVVYADRARRERPAVKGFVSATRGNHGQSLAYAGRAAGLRVVIVVPEGNSPDKNAAMEGFGAQLIVHGRDFQEAREYAAGLGEELGLEPVPAFHPDLVLGVATYAKELFDAMGDVEPLDTVYVPVGMGSGICGLIGVRDVLGLPTEIVGVVSDLAPATALSFRAREVRTTPEASTFVDGVACRAPVAEAVAAMVRGAARVLAVPDDACAEAMRLTLRTTHQLPEPAGALALAGLMVERDRMAGKRVAVIQSGGNCDASILAEILAGSTPRP
jgi:threonine dehydratase